MFLEGSRVRVALSVGAIVLSGACTAAESPTADSTPHQPSASQSPSPKPTPVTGHVRVENQALGSSERLVTRAIHDLKALGFWDDLTDHLYVLKISSRPGRTRIPKDGHLADAFLTAQIDKRGAGSLCDILLFPQAMTDDLVRYENFYEQGLIADPTPTIRQFWVSILGHELAHCLHHGSGEPTAERWEKKVLAAARALTA